MIPSKRLSPFLVLVLGIFAVSTSAVFIRLAQREASSVAVAAYRLSIASLILLPFGWRRRQELRALDRGKWLLLVLSGALLAVHFITWISSLAYTSVASSVVLVTTTPLWVALLSPLFLRERLTRVIWIGLVVALMGGVVVALNDACLVSSGTVICPGLAGFFEGEAFLGNSLALIGAVMAAGYMIIGRKVRPGLSITAYISVVYGVAALLLDIAAIFAGKPVWGYSPTTYLWFAALALFPQLLGHTSYNYALGYLPAAYVSVATLAEPIGSTLLAIVILSERPSGIEVIGGAVILAGIAIASLNSKSNS